jgi:hypothetical protein
MWIGDLWRLGNVNGWKIRFRRRKATEEISIGR